VIAAGIQPGFDIPIARRWHKGHNEAPLKKSFDLRLRWVRVRFLKGAHRLPNYNRNLLPSPKKGSKPLGWNPPSHALSSDRRGKRSRALRGRTQPLGVAKCRKGRARTWGGGESGALGGLRGRGDATDRWVGRGSVHCGVGAASAAQPHMTPSAREPKKHPHAQSCTYVHGPFFECLRIGGISTIRVTRRSDPPSPALISGDGANAWATQGLMLRSSPIFTAHALSRNGTCGRALSFAPGPLVDLCSRPFGYYFAFENRSSDHPLKCLRLSLCRLIH